MSQTEPPQRNDLRRFSADKMTAIYFPPTRQDPAPSPESVLPVTTKIPDCSHAAPPA